MHGTSVSWEMTLYTFLGETLYDLDKTVMENMKKNQFVVKKWQEFGEIWWIFTRAHRNFKIFNCMGYFCPKYIMFELKKYKGVMFYDNEEWCKTWRIKLTCGLENDMGDSANFHQNIWECLNWNFDGIHLSKKENAWAKKLQRSYV